VHGPVLCVGDVAGGGGLDVEVVDVEVRERGVGVGADLEGGFRAGGVDVPDVDIAEVWQALGFGYRGGERDPVGETEAGLVPGGRVA